MTALAEPAWNLSSKSDAFASVFRKLVAEWKRESGYLSSARQMAVLPSYQRIIGLGPAVLPHLLEELEREPDHWFWALESITGENPTLPEHRGILSKMALDWLTWGRQNGLLGFRDEP